MPRYRRLLVALVALLTLLASAAGRAWAIACVGASAEPSTRVADDAQHHHGTAAGHAEHPAAHHAGAGAEDRCPMPALSSGGCTVASLPASPVRFFFNVPVGDVAVIAAPPPTDRLAVAGLFRPPRS